MENIKIKNYSDLEKIKELNVNKFIINLKDCELKQKERVIDFFCGLTFLHGSMKKINSNEFEIRIED